MQYVRDRVSEISRKYSPKLFRLKANRERYKKQGHILPWQSPF